MALFNNNLQLRRFIGEIGFTILNAYFGSVIQQKRWEKFSSHPLVGIGRVVQGLYANVLHRCEYTCLVRGKWVPFGMENI